MLILFTPSLVFNFITYKLLCTYSVLWCSNSCLCTYLSTFFLLTSFLILRIQVSYNISPFPFLPLNSLIHPCSLCCSFMSSYFMVIYIHSIFLFIMSMGLDYLFILLLFCLVWLTRICVTGSSTFFKDFLALDTLPKNTSAPLYLLCQDFPFSTIFYDWCSGEEEHPLTLMFIYILGGLFLTGNSDFFSYLLSCLSVLHLFVFLVWVHSYLAEDTVKSTCCSYFADVADPGNGDKP